MFDTYKEYKKCVEKNHEYRKQYLKWVQNVEYIKELKDQIGEHLTVDFTGSSENVKGYVEKAQRILTSDVWDGSDAVSCRKVISQLLTLIQKDAQQLTSTMDSLLTRAQTNENLMYNQMVDYGTRAIELAQELDAVETLVAGVDIFLS